jgi:Flp pilus assembly protein TadG
VRSRHQNIKPNRSRFKGDSGAELVEFALVIPVLLALVYGVVLYGTAFFVHESVIQAAEEGARASIAATGSTPIVTGEQLATEQASTAMNFLGNNASVTSANVYQCQPGPCCMVVNVKANSILPSFGLPVPTLTAQAVVTVPYGSDGGAANPASVSQQEACS